MRSVKEFTSSQKESFMKRGPTIPKRQLVYPIGPSIAYVPLTRGLFSLIDREDGERVGRHSWSAQPTNSGRGFYAARGFQRNGRSTTEHMHAFIIGKKGWDHKDNKAPLDNRRCNLRKANHSQQSCNRGHRVNAMNALKGTRQLPSGMWIARIQVEGKREYLGTFPTEELAYEAYCNKAIELHGEYRRLA